MFTALLTLFCVAGVLASEKKTLTQWGTEFGYEGKPVWLTDGEIEHRLNSSKTRWINYVDLTVPTNASMSKMPRGRIPQRPEQQAIVTPLLETMEVDNVEDTVTYLSENFHTRHRNTEEGAESAEWIAEQFQKAANGDSRVTVELFEHSQFPQHSVITKLQGSAGPEEDVIVIGAHLDSTAGAASNRAPGADDDASGVAVMLEAFRAVVADPQFKPKRSVYFLSFAGEEGGLVGSRDIAQKYFQQPQIPILGMLQSEMNGYQTATTGKQFSIIQDAYTDDGLGDFLVKCFQEYLPHQEYNLKRPSCGYGCSDHVSFYNAGYKVGCVAEDGPFGNGVNPYMHTSSDTIDKMNVEQSFQFGKLMAAFAVEMSLAP